MKKAARQSIGASIVLLGLVAAGWWTATAPNARPFDPARWASSDDPYLRVAMGDDLSRRMIAEHWDEARVRRETGSSDSGRINLGRRSMFEGTYYLHVSFDADGRVAEAAVRPD